MNLNEWRNKHRKCAWCIHMVEREVFDYDAQMEIKQYVCSAKLKVVNPLTPRPFCRVFEQDKGVKHQ